jgi:type IV secretory pathway VirB6-like protein
VIPAFLAPYLAKFGATLAVALLVFAAGFYAGFRFEEPAVLKAQLALAGQQKADALATSEMNAKAAADMLAQDAVNNSALAAHQGRAQAASNAAMAAAAANDALAATPGDDGPVAPDLRKVLNDYAASEGVSK